MVEKYFLIISGENMNFAAIIFISHSTMFDDKKLKFLSAVVVVGAIKHRENFHPLKNILRH